MNKIMLYTIFTMVIAIFFTLPLMAQTGPGPSLPISPEGAPIDGGLSLLVAAGVGYGIKKVKELRKKNNVK